MTAPEQNHVLINIEEMPQLRIIRLEGVINKQTLPDIEKVSASLVKSPDFVHKNTLVDVKQVSGFDSATIASFVLKISDLKKEHHRMGFINMPLDMRNLVDIFRVEKNFLVFDSEDDALMELTKPGSGHSADNNKEPDQ